MIIKANTSPEDFSRDIKVPCLSCEWEVKKLGEIAKIQRGASPRPIDDPKWFDDKSLVGWVRISDVTQSGKYLYSTVQKLSPQGINKSRPVKKDNLIMSICATVGRPIITKIDTCIHDGFVFFESLELNIEFIYYVLQKIENEWSKHGQTGSQMNLNTNLIKQTEVMVPKKVKEQKAIAEALSDMDALIEALDGLIAKKRAIKQGAMQELLTGKRRLPGFNGEWDMKKLGELADFYKGKGLPKSAINTSGDEYCIHYGELFTLYPEIIEEIYSRTNKFGNCFCSLVNDVLMPTSDVTPNGLAKASCILHNDVILGGDILIIRINPEKVFGPFLSYVIRYQKKQILERVTGTTVFHLYAKDMEDFRFLLPKVNEQREIISLLDDMESEISALEEKVSKTRQVKQGMMQELLTGRIRLV